MSASDVLKTSLGTGKCLDYPLINRPIAIPDASRAGHAFVFGTTRVGKTRLAENMIEQDIRKGNSVVYLDPKGDQEIWCKIVQVAFACGRQDDLMLINTAYPQYSIKIDPLSHWFIQEELVGHCVAGIKEGKEPFFRNVAKEICTAVISAFNAIAHAGGEDRAVFNFNDVKKKMSPEALAELEQELSTIDTEEAQEVRGDLKRIISSGQDYYNKISSSLRVALMELTTGNVGKIVGQAVGNPFIQRMEEGKGVILCCQLGSLIIQEAALTLGKVILSMTQSYVGRVLASRTKKIHRPLTLYIDESQSVFYGGIEDMFAKSGGANCYITAFAQSVNQIDAVMGKEYGRSILDNANTKIFLRVPDPDTAQYVASHFGTKKVLSPVIASGGNITTREVEEDIIKPFDVQSLKPREFLMLTYSGGDMHSGRFKGITDTTSDCWLDIEYPAAPSQ